MTGKPTSTIKSNRKPKIGLFLPDDKKGLLGLQCTKDHIHAVAGIDFLV
jgi:hypothetical protein